MKEVKEVFNDKTKCPFTFNPETDAKVISGAFEGIYAWISLNFLKGRFIPENSESSFGILEVGGASHQNDFEKPSKETTSLTIGRKTYHGLDEARKQYFETLAQNPTVNGVLQSPCHHNGFLDQIPINGGMFTIRGTAQVKECRSIIQQTFFCKINCWHCTKPLSPAMYDVSSQRFCAKKYQEVSSDPYAKNNCFSSNFVFELLLQGYGLPVNKPIEVGNQVEGFDMGWTLGAMLHNLKLL